jgi:hypothetical protein
MADSQFDSSKYHLTHTSLSLVQCGSLSFLIVMFVVVVVVVVLNSPPPPPPPPPPD